MVGFWLLRRLGAKAPFQFAALFRGLKAPASSGSPLAGRGTAPARRVGKYGDSALRQAQGQNDEQKAKADSSAALRNDKQKGNDKNSGSCNGKLGELIAFPPMSR
jgi:hypothetical protein